MSIMKIVQISKYFQKYIKKLSNFQNVFVKEKIKKKKKMKNDRKKKIEFLFKTSTRLEDTVSLSYCIIRYLFKSIELE